MTAFRSGDRFYTFGRINSTCRHSFNGKVDRLVPGICWNDSPSFGVIAGTAPPGRDNGI